jgi:ABC-type nitrate/sulfonate/bicarbonate transport system substrate-binding protein
MYWFLVVRKNLNPRRGDLAVVQGLRIGAAPGPVDGLKQMLKKAGVDAQVGPVPGVIGEKASFGLMAAQALEEGSIDGFWANGMGAEIAVRSGAGAVVVDARRDGTEEWRGYTFPALVATDRTKPEIARAAVQAVSKAQAALKGDPDRATAIGRKLFPPAEAGMIAELIARDLPFYDASISERAFLAMNRFARDLGILGKDVSYKEVVWNG